ncbi:MAG: DUF1801 domain-containing protein [Pseudomonadota bacterium]
MTEARADIACPAFANDTLSARFAAFPVPQKAGLLALRSHIFALAGERFGPGRLVESLKWNQPAFNIIKPKRGTTLRMGADEHGSISLFFTCTSGLVDRFRDLYGDELTFVGNRELQLGANFLPNPAIDHCILLALDPHCKG